MIMYALQFLYFLCDCVIFRWALTLLKVWLLRPFCNASNPSHPNPRIANVPEPLLRDGILQCVSCHDPHPSNPNWNYLRTDTGNGGQVQDFCTICHASKANLQEEMEERAIEIFSSMNEAAGPRAFGLNDPDLVISNNTPDYIRPLGNYDNSLAPAYNLILTQDWVWDINAQQVPESLQQSRDARENGNILIRTTPVETAEPATE